MRINTFTKLLILIPFFSVYAQKEFAFDLNMKTEPIEDGAINQTGIGVVYHNDIGSQNTLTNTFKYKNTVITNEIENYLIKNYVTNYSGTRFNSFENTFEFSHRLKEKTKLTVAVEPRVNYETSFDISALTVLGGIELEQTLDKNNSITVGVKRMTVFGKAEILPVFSYSHTFDKTMHIKLGFPNSELSFSNSIRNKFSINNDFNGSSYRLDQAITSEDANSITKVGFSQMETKLQFERNMDTSWYIGIEGGYASNKTFTFSNTNNSNTTNQTLKNGGIFSISIKYKL